MDYGQEKRGPGRLEYFLIGTLIVIVIWAAWIMLEPLVRPEIEQFVQRALESGLDTPIPTYTPSP
jgi:hypothetical protein